MTVLSDARSQFPLGASVVIKPKAKKEAAKNHAARLDETRGVVVAVTSIHASGGPIVCVCTPDLYDPVVGWFSIRDVTIVEGAPSLPVAFFATTKAT